MATAEMVINPSSEAVMKTAVPLRATGVLGSTQTYNSSMPALNPIFFAPGGSICVDANAVGSQWCDFFRNTISGFYISAPHCYVTVSSSIDILEASLAWDRLSLELMKIANLPSNWDNEGAEAIPAIAVQTAGILLTIARGTAERSAKQAPSSYPTNLPTIFASVEGGVTVKWNRGARELKCTVLGDSVEVVRWASPDRYESEGLWEVPVHRVAEHFEWLLQ